MQYSLVMQTAFRKAAESVSESDLHQILDAQVPSSIPHSPSKRHRP